MKRHHRFTRLFALAVILLTIPACQGEKMQPEGRDLPLVTVSYPIVKPIVDYKYYTVREIGPIQSVEIRARVSGYLDKIEFKPGAEVKAGQVLFVIDQRPYKADLDKAKSEVAACEARWTRAEADLERAKQLIGSKAISKEDYDRITSNDAESKAALEGAKATLEQAQNNWDYTVIKAPFAGRISRNLIDVGNLVQANAAESTLLTDIVDSSWVYAYFDMDEPTLLQLIRERIQDAKKAAAAAKNVAEGEKIEIDNDLSKIPVKMRVGNDTDFAYSGFLDFADNQINKSTGTISIRAKFENPKLAGNMRALVAGGHGEISVPVSDEYQAMLVPADAIQFDQSREVLYVVNDKDVVVSKPVKTGDLHGDLRVIREGIRPTDRIIVEGAIRVRPGVTVKPVNAEQPAAATPAEADNK